MTFHLFETNFDRFTFNENFKGIFCLRRSNFVRQAAERVEQTEAIPIR